MSSKKNQILEVSLSLFLEKGFDKTSITDILERLNIARGTLYYHFESKEAIMDAIIERAGLQIMTELENIGNDPSLSVYEKFFALFAGMNMRRLSGGDQIIDYLNRPQNALFHEKSNQMIIEKVSPILAHILSEGISAQLFENAFPDETAEMILTVAIGFLDRNNPDLTEKDLLKRYSALLYNVERMLGTEQGSFDRFRESFRHQEEGEQHELGL